MQEKIQLSVLGKCKIVGVLTGSYVTTVKNNLNETETGQSSGRFKAFFCLDS